MSEPVKPDSVLGRLGRPEDVEEALVEGASCGTRRSRRPGSATDSRSMCCPTAPTRWTSATHDQLGPSLDSGSTRGGSVSDPRTGRESSRLRQLGSLRDRQDYMISKACCRRTPRANEKPAVLYETALKRIRQLSAHEVGHTLGLGTTTTTANTGGSR